MKKLLVIVTVLSLGVSSAFTQLTDTIAQKVTTPNAKLIAVHRLELEVGTSEKDFENFVYEKLIPLYQKVDGQDMYLMKGDRGKRTGKYALFILFNTVEDRDRIYPPSGGISEEFAHILEGTDEVWNQLDAYVVGDPFVNHTDYFRVMPPECKQ